MKKIFLLHFIVFTSILSFAQVPNWEWAKSLTGTGTEEGTSTAIDNFGNLYVTGTYNNYNFSVYSINVDTIALTGAGGVDIFIFKYNQAGDLLWAKTIGGAGEERSMCIQTDIDGNVYLAGYFSSANFAIDTVSLTTTAGFDMFISKFNSDGEVQWAKNAGGNSADYANGISIDDNGNSYVTGYFKSATITFGSTTISNPNSSFGGSKYFVAKYDASGNSIWAKTADLGAVIGNSIAKGTNSDFFVTGDFTGTVTFDTATAISVGGNDIFIARYDTSGNIIWVKTIGGDLNENGAAIATDALGNTYITGFFKSISMTVGTTSLFNNGSPDGDALIVKYDILGNVTWVRKAIGYSNDAGLAIGVEANGNSYITGYYNGSLLTFGTLTLNSAGATTTVGDLFIVKYDSNGNAIWAKNLLSSAGAWGKGIDINNYGECFITGFYEDVSIMFGNITLSNTSIVGVREFFVAKLDTGSTTVNLMSKAASRTFEIQPNPSNGIFKVVAKTNEINRIEIYNPLGELFYNSTFTNQSLEIDISNYTSGIYLIKAYSDSQIIKATKLIID